jgi:hypothetical protein
MVVFFASSAILAGPAARPSNKPISFAAKRCFAAIKPIAIFMMGSGVRSAICKYLRGEIRFKLVQVLVGNGKADAILTQFKEHVYERQCREALDLINVHEEITTFL